MSDDEESYFGDIDTNGKCWDNDYNSQANPTLSVMSNLKLEAVLDKDQGLNSTHITRDTL